MYKQAKKQYTIIIVAFLLLLISGVLFRHWEKEKAKECTVAGKVEALGEENFVLRLVDPVLAENTEQNAEIEWWFQEEEAVYYLFLPEAVKDNLVYLFNLYEAVSIDDRKVVPGDSFHLQEGMHEIILGNGQRFPLMVMYSYNLASMYIETESGNMDALIEDRDNIEQGSYILLDENGKVNCNGSLEEMHSRGNASFQMCDKKSFTLRMEQKTSVLDMGTSRKWLLLANATDETLIRNRVVMEMGRSINMAYVPDMVHVDLYINGEYQGNYQLSEKIEIDENRVAIRDLKEDMEDVNPNVIFSELRTAEEETEIFPSLRWVPIVNLPLDSTSGYLLELEMKGRYEEEPCGFISSRGQRVVPQDPQYVNREQILYLANLYQDMEDALYSPDGYNEETGLYYSDYLDMESFAKKYLIEEIAKNLDASVTSFFFYIPEGDTKFYAGPIWDYDRTFGVDFDRDGIDLKDPDTLFASEDVYSNEAERYFLPILCEKKDFQNIYKEMYFSKMRTELLELVDSTIQEYAENVESSAMMDAVRWDVFENGSDITMNRDAFWTSVENIKTFLECRIEFLDDEWK